MTSFVAKAVFSVPPEGTIKNDFLSILESSGYSIFTNLLVQLPSLT
ncbi:MAG: hypothetical protein N2319_07450 [Candidatus Kapabacteria bacterium]|nr:hypothetical protein [Candidatus Kapabacteria bacterium]